jgi:predicted homoserine dehydrogenase-like protein
MDPDEAKDTTWDQAKREFKMALKIGIIGAGGMAFYHIPGFRNAGAEVVAIADMNAESAKRAAEKYGVEKTFGSAKEMYEKLKDLTPSRSSPPTPSIIPW